MSLGTTGQVSYLRQFFKPLPKITNYHHFICHSNGTIAKKLFTHTDPQEISLQTATLETPVAFMMEELEEEGLSLERQWYLYACWTHFQGST